MSGIRFCELLTAHTQAAKDQDHLNFLLSSRADTPDRTDFILGRSCADPVPAMQAEVRRLIEAGASLIAIPCNTAHHFYDRLSAVSEVPVINIIDQTADFCRFCGFRRVGVLATEGTVASGAYEQVCRRVGLDYVTCDSEDQAVISHMIYEQIKQGRPAEKEPFLRIADKLRHRGCDTVILGCTELSLLKRDLGLGEELTDSLEVLACARLLAAQAETGAGEKEPVGFDDRLMKFFPMKGTAICC